MIYTVSYKLQKKNLARSNQLLTILLNNNIYYYLLLASISYYTSYTNYIHSPTVNNFIIIKIIINQQHYQNIHINIIFSSPPSYKKCLASISQISLPFSLFNAITSKLVQYSKCNHMNSWDKMMECLSLHYAHLKACRLQIQTNKTISEGKYYQVLNSFHRYEQKYAQKYTITFSVCFQYSCNQTFEEQ